MLMLALTYLLSLSAEFDIDVFPRIFVSPLLECEAPTGRFVIQELVRDGLDEIESLAIDFEYDCEDDGTKFYGAYRATFHTVDGTEEQVKLAARARVILERISADLESIYISKDGFLQGEKGDIGGNRADRDAGTRHIFARKPILFISPVNRARRAILRAADQRDCAVAIADCNGGRHELAQG